MSVRKSIALKRLVKPNDTILCFEKALEIDPKDVIIQQQKNIVLEQEKFYK